MRRKKHDLNVHDTVLGNQEENRIDHDNNNYYKSCKGIKMFPSRFKRRNIGKLKQEMVCQQ